MHVFDKLSLTYKLPAIIVALALIAAGATAALVVSETSAQIHDLAEARLENNVAAHKEAITTGITKDQKFLHAERDNPAVQAALRGLSAAWRDIPGDAGEQVRQILLQGGKPAAGGALGASEGLNRYESAHEAIDTYLRQMTQDQGFYDIFLIDLQGNVVYTAAREEDFGANVDSGPLADTGLGEVFAAAQTGGEEIHFSDLAKYAPSKDLPARFTATAVIDERGQMLGVLAIQSANELNAIVQYNPQLGETGTSFLIGEDLLLRTDHGDEKALVNGDDDPGIKRALAGETGLEWITDHTGTEVLSAYTPITFGDVTWALLSEQQRSEIFAPVNRLIREVLINLLVAAVIISGVGLLVARSITRPLATVGATMAQVAHRQFAVEIPATNRGDEIGSIAKSLASLRDDLAEAEGALFERTAVIDAISSLQGVIEFDTKGKILSMNQNFLDVVGYTAAELVGPHASLVDPEYAASNEYQAMWTGLANGRAHIGVFKRIGKGGKVVYIQAAYNPVRDRDGNVVRVVTVASDVTAAETARLKGIEERAAMEAEQSRVVEKLSGSLSMLADGDLTMRIEQAFAPQYEALRGNFNDVVTRLEEAISTVVVTVDSIRNDSIQVSQAADELSHRTENQAAALEESAASLEQLTSSVKSAASTAERANKDVDAARKSAEDSGRIVRDAVEAMSEIEKSSKHISQIIGVIDDIAFQTNLLALNAGVEAARAGDAGRGFAVVASEVRALAQRSSDAAKEIKDLISTSSQHVGRGVELVRETGRSLETIVGSVSEITSLIGEIANSAREQSVGLTEINTAVSQLDQVTQQNAAMVEESTAASHAMKSEAESLATLVGQFKARAGDAAAGSVKPTHGPQVKPGRKAGSPKPGSAPLPARANGSSGGGREKQDEWQDF